jgi:MinD superfamily P-loop ATPase
VRKITVLSGKGGTGKSSVVASLAYLLAEEQEIVAADCDVETPNLGIFFGLKEGDFSRKRASTGEKALLVDEKCTRCGRCRDACAFNAILWKDKPTFDRYLCVGCGACQMVCSAGAIKREKVNNGWIGHVELGNLRIISGQLKPGESGSGEIVMLVKEEAEKMEQKAETMLIDAPAGIGCPVIASVSGSDYVLAVTEPTVPALRDMKRALQVVEHFNIPYGIVINKWNLNKSLTKKIKDFANPEGIEIIGEIPYDERFVRALVDMKPVVEYDGEFRPLFTEILNNIQ